jgi:hypothetical protein
MAYRFLRRAHFSADLYQLDLLVDESLLYVADQPIQSPDHVLLRIRVAHRLTICLSASTLVEDRQCQADCPRSWRLVF